MRQTYRFEGEATQEDRQRSAYFYLPFEVPAATTRIEVQYHYEGAGRGNTLDIGIFDPRGTGMLDGGFRGWSGGARAGFFIARNSATPGYLPGPLIPGTWKVILGLAEMDAPSFRYWVDVGVEVDVLATDPGNGETPVLSAVSPVVRPGPPSGRWWKGDFHSHTVHSDGANTIPELVASARERGLDFLAITDHNTTSHHVEIAALGDVGLLLVPGEEVTSYHGHANVWGVREWVDFRFEDEVAVRRLMDLVHAKEAIFSFNHPKHVGPPWEFPQLTPRAMEVWQAPWRWYNWEAVALWESKLAAGEQVAAVGGSDTHTIPPAKLTHPHGLGEPTTWVWVEGDLTEQSLLGAVARGRAFISESAAGPLLDLRADGGDGCFGVLPGGTVSLRNGEARLRIRYEGPADKRLLVYQGRDVIFEARTAERETREVAIRSDGPSYVRAEVRGFRGRPERGEVVHAMTNPVYLQTESQTER